MDALRTDGVGIPSVEKKKAFWFLRSDVNTTWSPPPHSVPVPGEPFWLQENEQNVSGQKLHTRPRRRVNAALPLAQLRSTLWPIYFYVPSVEILFTRRVTPELHFKSPPVN